MKKILILLFCTLIALSMISCGDTKDSKPADKEVAGEKIEVDKNISTVDITIPASMYEGQDMSTFDAEAYSQENGFNKAVVNQDGSVTVTIAKSKHKEILEEMQASMEDSYQELVDSVDAPYINNIEHDDGFKTITVEVERAGYDNAMFDMTPFIVGLQAAFYQVFAGQELHSEVVMKYQDTGELISTTVYPDDWQNIE